MRRRIAAISSSGVIAYLGSSKVIRGSWGQHHAKAVAEQQQKLNMGGTLREGSNGLMR
jgi:hypothetical protein